MSNKPATIWISPNASAQLEWAIRQQAKRDGYLVMPSRPFPWNRKLYREFEKAQRQESAS